MINHLISLKLKWYGSNLMKTLYEYSVAFLRSSSSPIFDTLYWVTRKRMNKDMLVDADDMITNYLSKKI